MVAFASVSNRKAARERPKGKVDAAIAAIGHLARSVGAFAMVRAYRWHHGGSARDVEMRIFGAARSI
jgi:hypothetical protein